MSVGLLGACTKGSAAQSPEEVLDEYAEAIEAGNAERAWALLSEDARRATSYPAFRAELERDPAAAAALARALRAPPPLGRITATITTSDGEELHLVWQKDRWRVEAGAIELYSQRSPEEAVRAFARAVRRGRYDVLQRLAPNADRPGLPPDRLRQAFEGDQREEIASLVAAIELALPEAEIEIRGDRATLGLGAGSVLELILEDGQWKISDYLP